MKLFPASRLAAAAALLLCGILLQPGFSADADLILHNGKVVTVDDAFSIHQAIAVRGAEILQVGADADLLKLRGPQTQLHDLQGRMVIPGLIDSHVHPVAACLTEFDHPIPDMETIADVLAYVRSRAAVLAEGEWIVLQQVFITRLREQRYPTRAELDAAAPKHPVLFRTGPDASLNTLALQLSGIDRNFAVTDGGSGFAEKDASGEPTGILRNCTRYVKVKSSNKTPTPEQHEARMRELFADYNSVGITSIGDRDTSLEGLERYRSLRERGELTVRVNCSHTMASLGQLEAIQERIRSVARNPLHTTGDEWLKIIGIKMYLDGGMLTGSAFMQEPWGASEIYGITDPEYRGVLFIPRERLLPLVRTAVESGLQFTAHSQGNGAVQTLLDVYEEITRERLPVRETRCSITHSSFMSRESVEQAARLGVMFDMQPAWLYLDANTLAKHFGNERFRWFIPLRSLFAAGANVGGGSDHMQKIGSRRAINFYDPFLGMQTAVTRRARWFEGALHPEEALTREQMLRLYTINNARLLFSEKRVGSLERGKLADFVVLDTDLLTCADDAIEKTRVLRTYLGGKLVFEGDGK